MGGFYSLDDLDGFLTSLEEKDFSSTALHVTRGLDGAVKVDVARDP